jgi:PAS domain-containing protein
VTHLKIARPFVERMETDSKDLALVRGIIAMTHGLDQRVIAEGVETAGQRELLRSLGCDLGQGYLYSRPMPAHELGAALAESATPGRTAPRQVVRSLGHARLISHLPDLTIMLFDRNMRFLAADGSALERLGWPRGELEGKLVREVLPPDAAKGLELILEAVLSGTRRSFEWDTLDVEAEPIRDGVDEITGAVIVAREATQPSPVPEAVAGERLSKPTPV